MESEREWSGSFKKERRRVCVWYLYLCLSVNACVSICVCVCVCVCDCVCICMAILVCLLVCECLCVYQSKVFEETGAPQQLEQMVLGVS